MYALSKEINGHLKTGDSDDESERPQLFADSVPPSAEDLNYAEKQTQRAYTSRPDVDDDGQHPRGFFPDAYDGSHLGAGPVKVKEGEPQFSDSAPPSAVKFKYMKKQTTKRAHTSRRGPDDDDGPPPLPGQHSGVSSGAYDEHSLGAASAEKGRASGVARLPAASDEEEMEEIKPSGKGMHLPVSGENPTVERTTQAASSPRTRRAAPVAPGAVRVGIIDDEESQQLQEDTIDQPTSSEHSQMHLVSAMVVNEPILVSASQVTCNCMCCPYGRLTALPAVLGGIGSFFCMMAAFFGCLATYKYTSVSGYSYTSGCVRAFVSVIIGLVSGSLGGIAFVLSTVMSCATFSKTFLKILGGTYILLAITSLLPLVGPLASCNGGCTLAGGGIMAIVASLMFFGAGISTFFLKNKMQPSEPARLPSF